VQKTRSHALVIFDGDDTLWRTMPLYVDAKRRFFALVSELVPTASGIEEQFEERDRNNVAQWGFTIERFRNSMVETYRECMARNGTQPQFRREEQISRIAASVMRRRAARVAYAKTVLEKLAPSFRLVLLTKGEYELQNRRIAESGLRGVFERAMIVDHKDAGAFTQLVAELRVNPRLAWSVGDSLRSDIRPALAAGLRAVWVPQKTWSYEEDAPAGAQGGFAQIRSLRELPHLLGNALKEKA
jgi:putative hydrolase of the HAD superfamily